MTNTEEEWPPPIYVTSEATYTRLLEILDADEEDEYTRSDKEVPTPKPDDIWIHTTRNCLTDVRLIDDNLLARELNNYEDCKDDWPITETFTKQYTLVWRDGKRWDGA